MPGRANISELAETTDRARWRTLLSGLHIEELPGDEPVVTLDEPVRVALLSGLLAEGYYQHGPLVPAARTGPLAEAVLALRDAELPLELAFAFDELWQVARWFRPLLEAVLGTGFRQLPAYTIWCVDGPLDTGWTPHRDRDHTLLGSGMPGSLSVWLPLTEATPLNGCIYVLPSHLDPHYGTGVVPETYDWLAAQNIRALPSPAGAFLCWSHELLHWGGRSSTHATTPRISIGLEYQRGDLPAFGEPLVDPLHPPPLPRRLGLIGESILAYEPMRSTPRAHLELARRLVRHL
jgi:phytanoyl-CoA dioxygenase PhyH